MAIRWNGPECWAEQKRNGGVLAAARAEHRATMTQRTRNVEISAGHGGTVTCPASGNEMMGRGGVTCMSFVVQQQSQLNKVGVDFLWQLVVFVDSLREAGGGGGVRSAP